MLPFFLLTNFRGRDECCENRPYDCRCVLTPCKLWCCGNTVWAAATCWTEGHCKDGVYSVLSEESFVQILTWIVPNIILAWTAREITGDILAKPKLISETTALIGLCMPPACRAASGWGQADFSSKKSLWTSLQPVTEILPKLELNVVLPRQWKEFALPQTARGLSQDVAFPCTIFETL